MIFSKSLRPKFTKWAKSRTSQIHCPHQTTIILPFAPWISHSLGLHHPSYVDPTPKHKLIVLSAQVNDKHLKDHPVPCLSVETFGSHNNVWPLQFCLVLKGRSLPPKWDTRQSPSRLRMTLAFIPTSCSVLTFLQRFHCFHHLCR